MKPSNHQEDHGGDRDTHAVGSLPIVRFPHLFSPVDIGTLRLKNRIVMAPMETHLGHADGSVSPQMISYYQERAQGGVAMVVVEYTCVDGQDGFSSWSPQLRLDGAAYRAGHAKLVHALHQAGARACIELSHAGRQTRHDVIGRAPVSPSAIPLVAPQFTSRPRALEEEDIKRLVSRFATAAGYAVEAGYDAVMLHGAHGYLLHQFLSPRVNRRDDSWGGDFERRLRFPVEVVRAVRRAIGERALLYRMSVEDLMEDGLTIEDSVCIVPALRDAGVDAFDVSRGSIETADVIVDPMHVAEGVRLPLARRIRAVAGTPVLCAGVMRSPEKADAAIADGLVDLVSLGRALLADPLWPAKALAGVPQDIRPCTSCNWCVKEALASRAIACAENPRCGRESDLPIDPFGAGRSAVVVGAGPAGITASLLLGQAGYAVDLYEQRAAVGGNLIASAVPPGKDKLFWYHEFLVRRLAQSRVRTWLNTRAEVATIMGRRPDVVIVACGARLANLPLERSGDLPVHAAYRVLLGDVQVPRGTSDRPVVIYGGGETGAEAAEYLAGQGHSVLLVTRSGRESIARNADRSYRKHLLERLYGNCAVQILDRMQVTGVGGRTIMLRASEGHSLNQEASALLLAHGLEPDRELADALTSAMARAPAAEQGHMRVLSIGDANEVGRIGEAVRDAYRAVTRLRALVIGPEPLAC